MFDDEGYTIANPTLRKIRGLDEQGRLLPYTTAEMSDEEDEAMFEFDDEGIVCERVYFDSATILRQLGLMP